MFNPKIILLSNFLRKEGMLVSVRSTIRANTIWNNYENVFTENERYESLKTIYVKNKDDFKKFEDVYEKIFSNKQQEREEKINTPNDKPDLDFSQNINQPIENKNNNEEEIIEELIEDRQKRKIINQGLINDSVINLDNYDPRIFDICQRLSLKIANKRSKRKKQQKSSRIDMPRTIRHNLKYGGHLIKLIKQKPPLKKTKQIFLCDVSGSCEWISAWFFAILYGCYKTFNKIRVYDFDNKIIDITDTLSKEYENTTQINMAQKKLGVNRYGQSDMTKAFKEFLDEVPLNLRTDVIILTDCRDWNGEIIDGKLESAIILSKIVKKSRNVIILNPEKKIRWNNSTSHVKDYEDIGAKVFETNTLNQFSEVIEKL